MNPLGVTSHIVGCLLGLNSFYQNHTDFANTTMYNNSNNENCVTGPYSAILTILNKNIN